MSHHLRKLQPGATRLYRFPALGQSGEEAQNQQEQFEYGYQQGLEQGHDEGYQTGYQQGLTSGLQEGRVGDCNRDRPGALPRGWQRGVPSSRRRWPPLPNCRSSGAP